MSELIWMVNVEIETKVFINGELFLVHILSHHPVPSLLHIITREFFSRIINPPHFSEAKITVTETPVENVTRVQSL